MTQTINTKFDVSDLPVWAQNNKNVALACKYDLEFRVAVCRAGNESTKRQLRKQAQNVEEHLCMSCGGTGDNRGDKCIHCQGTGFVITW